MVLRKKPEAHCAQAVPLAAVVQPARQAHWPSDPHSPLIQLQVEGAFGTTGDKQRPEPAMPWSQFVHPVGHGWHVAPKKPSAHVSQAEPANPAGQTHVPLAEHTPDPEHAGEQEADCMSRRASELAPPLGSWETSGTPSQRIMRWPLDPPTETAAQTLVAMASELPGRFIEVFPIGAEGSGENADWPE